MAPKHWFISKGWNVSDDKLKYTCGGVTHGMISLNVGEHAKKGDSYIFCMTPEEAKKNTKDFEHGLITVREVPVVKKSTKVEIVYADEILEAYAGTENFNYKAMAEALAVERKEFDDQIVSQVVADVKQSVIDYDKLAVSIDRHIGGADADAGPSLASVLPMLVLIFTAVGYLMMFIKQAREERKSYTEALEKVLQKWDASSDKDDTGSTSKKTDGCSSEETSGEEEEEEEDDGDNSEDGEVETTATTNTTKSVPAFTEYVHGKAKPRNTKQEPTTTFGATASLDKAKVVDGDLSGFKNPAERELVEDMLIEAMVDILEHGDRVSLQYRESLPAPEARKNGLDLVNKICAKGKQYTDKAKRVAGVDGITHALEKKYKDTLNRGYNAGASSGRSGAKDDYKKRVEAKAASTSADCTAESAMHTEAHTTAITVMTTVTAAGKAPTITTKTVESKVEGPTAWYLELNRICKIISSRLGPSWQELTFLHDSWTFDDTIEARREYANKASYLHKLRVGRGLKITDEKMLSGSIYEEEEDDAPPTADDATPPHCIVRSMDDIKQVDVNATTTATTTTADLATPIDTLTSATSPLAATTTPKSSESKAKDASACYFELCKDARPGPGPAWQELTSSHDSQATKHTMGQRRAFANRASMLHKARTGRGPKVTEKAIRECRVYEEEDDTPLTAVAASKPNPRHPAVLWKELVDEATNPGLARDEHNYLRAAFRPHHTYTMENRRYYARKASEVHKQRTGFVLVVTDEAITRGIFHEKEEGEELVGPQPAFIKHSSAKDKEVEHTSTFSTDANHPSPAEPASVSPPISDASSTIATTNNTNVPEGKAGDPTAWYKELQELVRRSAAAPDEVKELKHFRASMPPYHTLTMERRRYYAGVASDLHKKRTGRHLKVTDEAILKGVFHEEREKPEDAKPSVSNSSSAKGKEPQQTSTLSTQVSHPSPPEPAPVPPEAKIRGSTTWYAELVELSRTSDVARDELKYIRTALSSYSTYNMDNRRFCAQRASMLHKQRTGHGLIVNDDAICSGVFHEEDDEQPIPKDTQLSPKPATSIQEEPTAIDASTNFDLINGMKVLNCGDGTFNERFAIFMVKHHGGYAQALEAIKVAGVKISARDNHTDLKDKLRFARFLILHLGGSDYASLAIKDIQRKYEGPKLGSEAATRTPENRSAASAPSSETAPRPKSMIAATTPATLADSPVATHPWMDYDLTTGMKVLNCGTGTFNERFAIFMVKHHGGYVEALSAIAQSMGCYPNYVELKSVGIVRGKLRFARFFVAHFGGYENAIRRIRELQRNDPEQKLVKEAKMERARNASAAPTASLETTPSAKAMIPAAPPATVDASTDHELIQAMKYHNCGKGPFEEQFGIFMIRHYAGSIQALEAIGKAVNPKTSSVPESKFARLFVAHLGGEMNGKRVIWDLQRKHGLQT